MINTRKSDHETIRILQAENKELKTRNQILARCSTKLLNRDDDRISHATPATDSNTYMLRSICKSLFWWVSIGSIGVIVAVAISMRP
jgi:hypothetical protein